MIDPHWNVVDLDPTTWRNLGPFIGVAQYVRVPPAEAEAPELFVLHDNGRVLKIHDTHAGQRRDLDLAHIDDPHETARALFAAENWGRVHVINKQHLANVARATQQIENRPLTLDAYYQFVASRLWREPDGYVCQPPRPPTWNGWTYADALRFVRRLPSPATVALGVFDDGALHLGLILEIRDGLIRTLTTFEALSLPQPLPLAKTTLDTLAEAIRARFAPLAAGLVCDRSVFEDWLKASDKAAFLRAAAAQRKAFWQLDWSPEMEGG